MTDWNTCPAVERRAGKLSGAWAFAGTRVPVSALFENLGSGATVEQFLDCFPDSRGMEGQEPFSNTRRRPSRLPAQP